VVVIILYFFLSTIDAFFYAGLPQSKNTIPVSYSFIIFMTSSVNFCQPPVLWDSGFESTTVRTSLSNKTPNFKKYSNITLFSPESQISMVWNLKTFNIRITCDLLEDIFQAWRWRNSFRHWEAETHCLTRLMIWILSNNYRLISNVSKV